MSRRFENDIRAWIDAQGSGVTDEVDMARDYAIITGGGSPSVTNNTDIVFSTLGPAVGVTYNNATGVITLGVGKTYLLQAMFHAFAFSAPANNWIGYAFVDLGNLRVGFGSLGYSGPVTGTVSDPDADVMASTVHTPTSGANNQVKLRIDAGYSNLLGTALINLGVGFITVQQLG